jgi:serine phosphatase RsbU (regulator of sigma subunit)
VSAILGFQGLRFEVAARSIAIGGGSPLLLAAFCGLVFLLVLELADRVLVRDELEVARQLQRELLPAEPPAIDGYSFAFSYRTANTIGGDYYDFLPVGSSTAAIVVADASGHGIAAGLLMAIANATLKLAVDLNPDPEAVADLMNRVLYRTGGSRSFMTMFYGLLDRATGRLEYVSVGHPYPLLRRASGDLEELGVGCLPLGVRSSITPRPGATTLYPGDLLIMYTDGIPEALDEQENAFGFERLSSLVALGGGAASVHDRAFAALDRFTEGAIQLDDRSLVVIGRDL